MSPMVQRVALMAALTSLLPLHASAQQRERGPAAGPAAVSDSALVATLKFRSIGPAVFSGRIEDIAVVPPPVGGGALGTVFYVGTASGGVWKTTNGAMSLTSLFDNAGPGSIGAVAVAPSEPQTVWVGTGEDNNLRSSSYGDGVYKSTDGGKTWTHMGLRTSQHVARIRIHPTKPDVVWVAAVGPLWGAGGERGVFKSIDGGKTWRNVLSVDANTGAGDLVLDPSNPDVMYAATHQRERRAYNFVGGGPGSGIWKSTDGGETWAKLSNGLPKSDIGRIGLDVSMSHPATVYAVTEGSEQGLYRTDDGGANWRKVSDIASIPWYFGDINVDPKDPETVYHLGVQLQVTHDGGATWQVTGRGTHSDHHALWINPQNPSHLILGGDGGLYVSLDRGTSWDFAVNLPLAQYYALALDMAEPFYNIAGGTQDNSTWGGPSRTRSADGIFNSDWYGMAGGDGFYAAIDPTDPDIAYAESQEGGIVRYDRRTGDRKGIQPQAPEGERPYRFNWSAPIKISPWDHNTVYFGGNFLFKSADRGDTWKRLGEDLTRDIDEDSLPLMGKVQAKGAVSLHEGVADFGTISDIDVSPLKQGMLVTGSDDGVVAISTDDGATWAKQTRFPGVPDTAYVSKVRFSRHDAAVVYVTFDNHRSNDFKPYVIRSGDGGRSWANITNNLPSFGNVVAFAEHPSNAALLFVGTEMGLFVSIDRGGTWTRMQGGLPIVPVHDLAVHPRDNALVVATHGRGFYILDDLGPLQHLAEAKAAQGAYLVPVKSEWLITPDVSRTSGTQATRDYAGANPPVGTAVSYLLKEDAKDVKLQIVAQGGEVVRTLDAPTAAGLHHVLWDFRMDAPYSGPPQAQPQQQGFGGFGSAATSAPVVPGTYTARLTAGGQTQERTFTVKKDPVVRLTDAELAQLRDFRIRQLRLNATLTMAIRQSDELRTQVTQAKAAVAKVSAPADLTRMLDAIETDLNDVRNKLGAGAAGGGGIAANAKPVPPRTVRQLLSTAGGANRANAMPTLHEKDALALAPSRLDPEVARLNALVAERMPALFKAMDAAGVPWTPGRAIK
ncbi:MAG: glycosyl hydrolase [Gemmatimonadetes bacterium]|nr:glycosyl hydrolase [Gemmatimonadota bacterium]